MRKQLVFATLGLAALAFALAPSSARADHCRSGGYGYGSYSGGYGGYGGYGGIRVVPSYGYGSSFGRRGVGGYYRGHGHHHHHNHGFYGNRGYYGRGYGSSFYLRSPGFSFGIYR